MVKEAHQILPIAVVYFKANRDTQDNNNDPVVANAPVENTSSPLLASESDIGKSFEMVSVRSV